MIIAVSCNYVSALDKYLEYYSDDAKKCKFVFCRQDIAMEYSKGREAFGFSDNDVINMINKHNIKDYVILHASDIVKKFDSEMFTKFYELVKNMICPMLSPWYINKYIDNTQDILWIDEDVLVRFSQKYIDYLSSQPYNLAHFYGMYNNGYTEYTECGLEWLRIMGEEPIMRNTLNISLRHICGAPAYYKKDAFEGFYDYAKKVFTSDKLYLYHGKGRSYHHGFIDEYFRSCSPITYKPFDKYHVKVEFVGDKGLEKFRPNYRPEVWFDGMIHLAGSNKIIKLDRVVSLMEAKYGNK